MIFSDEYINIVLE